MKFSLPILASILLLLTAAFSQAKEPDKMARADALLQQPALTLPQAQQALALYEEQLHSGGDRLSLLPRLARTAFVLGDLAPSGQQAGYYDQGLAYAETLLKAQPGGVAGHYWKALNMCGLADVGSRFQGFRLLPKIIAALQQSLALDEAYDQAGAHRVLGRIYFEAPGRPFSVGDLDESRRQLSAAVRLAPDNSTNHLYLAETLLKMGHQTQARAELQKVLQARRHAIRSQGLAEDQREARRLLAELNNAT
jgi:tetratricopeptide (TPR) repeat protein